MASYESLPVESLCPCRNGRVTATFHSPNFPRGRAYYDNLQVHCEKCKNDREAHSPDNYEWSYSDECA